MVSDSSVTSASSAVKCFGCGYAVLCPSVAPPILLGRLKIIPALALLAASDQAIKTINVILIAAGVVVFAFAAWRGLRKLSRVMSGWDAIARAFPPAGV